jgi:hypothetical protein
MVPIKTKTGPTLDTENTSKNGVGGGDHLMKTTWFGSLFPLQETETINLKSILS